MSWVVVSSNENSTKDSYQTVRNQKWYLGVYSPSQGAACAVGRLGGAAQGGSASWRRSLDPRPGSQQSVVRGSGRKLFLYLTSQLLQEKHTWTFRPGLRERDVCTLLLYQVDLGSLQAGYVLVTRGLEKFILRWSSLSVSWILGSRLVLQGWALLYEKVIDCSSVPHKMAWRSVTRAIRTVARLGGQGCEIFGHFTVEI